MDNELTFLITPVSILDDLQFAEYVRELELDFNRECRCVFVVKTTDGRRLWGYVYEILVLRQTSEGDREFPEYWYRVPGKNAVRPHRPGFMGLSPFSQALDLLIQAGLQTGDAPTAAD